MIIEVKNWLVSYTEVPCPRTIRWFFSPRRSRQPPEVQGSVKNVCQMAFPVKAGSHHPQF